MIRIGRLQLSLEGLVLVGALMVAASWLGTWGSRADGAREAQLAALRAENDSLRQIRARVDTLYARDTVVLWRTIARYDSVRVTDTLVRNDTVFIPRVVADAAIAACRATVLTCEQRVAIRDRENGNLRAQNRLLEERSARAWTAAGLSYNPSTGDVGAWVDRDLWRIRGGVGVTPGRNGLLAELRAGWRW